MTPGTVQRQNRLDSVIYFADQQNRLDSVIYFADQTALFLASLFLSGFPLPLPTLTPFWVSSPDGHLSRNVS